ncbi:alpha/beta fold hydrolase [Marinimicrobium sp. ABcell2]|uniref:alpha/beta fold hydrolase n=1 Tax=Marinimicrobium sp. ABcell2 TaxID=3069751 RepID=UPI0027B2B498|nr:alpha/beta hydrolase [Marinimicrobium sp. ABcell2]MDQ2076423.1 alpha/beta hydrolase [Marinimicrobium sp. ABcell2]
MARFKKTLKVFGLLLLLVLAAIVVHLYHFGPELPENTEQVIERATREPVPELVRGESGLAQSNGTAIWYERIGTEAPPRGTVMLIMGIATDSLNWSPDFVDAFVDAGYQVIRYDHRDTGLSDWQGVWWPGEPYDLADMADDSIAVLDAVGVDQAHVVGLSMGGMIAQEMAINHPQRVASLISLMSSADIDDASLPGVSYRVIFDMLRASLKYGLIGGEENMIRLAITLRLILRDNPEQEMDVEEVAQQVLYNERIRRGYNTFAPLRHQRAIGRSASRPERLAHIDTPTLVIHGTHDPLIPLAHGEHTAEVIPDARTYWVEGLGHDIPHGYIDDISGQILAFLEQLSGSSSDENP